MTCGSTLGHRAGCPETDEREPEIIGYCSICGDPIEEGEDHFDIDGTKHHVDCFNDEYLVKG